MRKIKIYKGYIIDRDPVKGHYWTFSNYGIVLKADTIKGLKGLIKEYEKKPIME